MTRKLKSLGGALVAALAISAVVGASGAQAAAPEFHCTSTTAANCTIASLAATQLKVSHGISSCTESAYSATAPKTTTTLTVSASYAGCKTFGVKSQVKMNECDYVFNLVASSSPATAKVDVKCPAGKKIEIIAATLPCTITIGEQAGIEHIVFTNSGTEPTGIVANETWSNTAVTKIGAGCSEGPGAAIAEMSASTPLNGFEDPGGTQVGLHVF